MKLNIKILIILIPQSEKYRNYLLTILKFINRITRSRKLIKIYHHLMMEYLLKVIKKIAFFD